MAAASATLAVALLVVLGASPSSANASSCHTAVQNVTKRKNISCKQAKKVANKSYRAVPIPECKGEPSVRWNGWRIWALDDRGIIIGFKKGNRKFHLTGGGAC